MSDSEESDSESRRAAKRFAAEATGQVEAEAEAEAVAGAPAGAEAGVEVEVKVGVGSEADAEVSPIEIDHSDDHVVGHEEPAANVAELERAEEKLTDCDTAIGFEAEADAETETGAVEAFAAVALTATKSSLPPPPSPKPDSEQPADDTAHAESVKFLTTDVMKNFNTTADDYHTSQSNLMASGNELTGRQFNSQLQQHQNSGIVDEMSQDLNYLSHEAPLDGGESTFGGAASYSHLGGVGLRDESALNLASGFEDEEQQRQRQLLSESPIGFSHNEQVLNQLSPDNVDIKKPLQQSGGLLLSEEESQADKQQSEESSLALKPFLVSFMVDARGGAMRGCRHSGVRVIIPPNSAQMPMRITCRYLRRERLVHPPPLMEGEACASKIMEVGPAGAKFLGPVLIEVPHFASLRGQEREIIILRSDSGEVWREHLVEADEQLIESIIKSAGEHLDGSENVAPKQQQSSSTTGSGANAGEKRRLTRIVTNEFPQYFAIISRIRQEVHAVGPEGSTVNSQAVPRVQAIFTEGALTKRIKIGLQPKVGNKKSTPLVTDTTNQAQADATSSHQAANVSSNREEARAPSPSSQQQADSLESNQDRAVSPLSNQGSQTAGQQRPGSSAAKRRSRFLACFGAGHGSVDLLNSATDESSAGGESPPQPCNEKLVQRRHILGDVSDSEGETRESPSPSSLSGATSGLDRGHQSRSKRHAPVEQLVPDDYYIEREPALILNMRPKTYGKRLASSAAQTDSKLSANGYLSTSAKKAPKGRGGLLRGRRKHKTQLTIRCDAPTAAPDSSLDASVDANNQLHELNGRSDADHAKQTNFNDNDTNSIIQDVITSDDHKWRTCTIQTDSDSVTVNYVTIDQSTPEVATATVATGTATGTGTGLDDGYVSGSGELKKENSFGKGLFGLSAAFGGAESRQQVQVKERLAATADAESKREKKLRAKGDKKAAKVAAKRAKSTSTSPAEVTNELPVAAISGNEVTLDDSITISERASSPADDEKLASIKTQTSVAEESSSRSISPTSKELKQKLKMEKKREKEEKRQQKELEEAAAKAQKLKEKQEKQAAKKAQKSAKKAATGSISSSPIASSTPQLPSDTSFTVKSTTSQVKFASDDIPRVAASHEPAQQMDSIQRVIESTNASYEREKAQIGQEDGHDMVQLSISARLQPESATEPIEHVGQVQPHLATEAGTEIEAEKLISFSDSDANPSISLATDSISNKQYKPDDSESFGNQNVPLKPILKQQSTISSSDAEVGTEIVISEQQRGLSSVAGKLVSEATEEAVRLADKLKAESANLQQHETGNLLSSASSTSKEESAKEAKKRLKREAKEAKRVAEAAKKAQEAETKRLAKEAKLESERLAKEAKLESERLAKERKLENERLAKEARVASEQAAKEAKLKAKLEKEEKKRAKKEAAEKKSGPTTTSDESEQQAIPVIVEPSAPTCDQIEEIAESAAERKDDHNGDAHVEIKQVVTSEVMKLEKELEQPEANQIALADLETSLVGETATSEEKKSPKKEKTKKKEKPKKEKTKKKSDIKQNAEAAELSESTEPVSAASKSSFLSRLFGKRSSSNKFDGADVSQPSKQTLTSESANEELRKQAADKPMIMSEMYPSDPNDLEGEMILEVNVPRDMLENQLANNQQATALQLGAAHHEISQAGDTTTTIDESLASRTLDEIRDEVGKVENSQRSLRASGGELSVEQPTTTVGQDDQATLVNLSQMVTSDDALVDTNADDEATENIVSQVDETFGPIADGSVRQSPEIVAEQGQKFEEKQQQAASGSDGVDQLGPVKSEQAAIEQAAAAMTLPTDEKMRKELETKLAKEAKKRAKEEAKAKKKLAEEEKVKSKLEAKRLVQEKKLRLVEEKKRAKEEALEAKRLEALAKKQRESDKKKEKAEQEAKKRSETEKERGREKVKKGKETKIKVIEMATGGPSEQVVAETSQEMAGEHEASAIEAELLAATSNLEPVNTETEVQRIVEEVVGEDGVITKTTKTIETKYVTLRQEELRISERQDMPIEEYERVKRSLEKDMGGDVEDARAESERIVSIETSSVPAYTHLELDEIRATPSFFGPELPTEVSAELSEKKALKKRIKLNQKLIKRALKLAKSESKRAKKGSKAAQAEIAVCDEAAKEARKELRRALKQAKKAAKEAAHAHKKMDKVDKKLAKRQKKIEKRQKELDKRAAKLAKKAAKKRAKQLAKEARAPSQASGRSTSSKKSIKLADIGEPVLRSSSRLSIGGHQQVIVVEEQGQLPVGSSSAQMVSGSGSTVIEGLAATATAQRNESPASGAEDLASVEMSLDDADQRQQQQLDDMLATEMVGDNEEVVHTITTTIVTEQPDGLVSEQVRELRLTGAEARAAAERMDKLTEVNESDEEIDVVNDLPQIGNRSLERQQQQPAE